MAEGDGTVIDGQPDKTVETKFGDWRDQLPQDLRGNEVFTSFKGTLGDFAKGHLDTLGRVKDFEGKVANSIPKLSDKSTPEEISAYRKATGVPDKPEEYEFPQTEGTENSPEMIAWGQKTFHELGLPKDVAQKLGGKWNAFVAGMVEAESKMAEEEKVENEKKFRAEFKTEEEYKAGYKLTKRFWNKVMGTDFDEAYKEAEAWQVPVFMRALFIIAKKTGEDFSPPGGQSTGGEVKPEMIYDKTPSMRGG